MQTRGSGLSAGNFFYSKFENFDLRKGCPKVLLILVNYF